MPKTEQVPDCGYEITFRASEPLAEGFSFDKEK
jgi:hypothetical protein